MKLALLDGTFSFKLIKSTNPESHSQPSRPSVRDTDRKVLLSVSSVLAIEHREQQVAAQADRFGAAFKEEKVRVSN